MEIFKFIANWQRYEALQGFSNSVIELRGFV